MFPVAEAISRRGFLKASGSAALSVALLEALAALGATAAPVRARSSAQGRSLTVAVIAQQMAAQSNQRTVAGFDSYLKAKNLTWNVNQTDAKGDPGTLSNMVSDAASRKVDAILVLFGTLTAAQGALKTVADANIPFFSVDSGWFPPAICDIASNNYLMGAQMSEYMVQRLLGSGKTEANICTIIANFHHGTRKRGKVLEQVLSENEWIKVLDSRVIQYEGFYETTLNAVNDWLTRFGDQIHAIWTPWDEPATAAATAIVNSGRDVTKIFVVGADGHPPAVEQMRDPAWPLVATPAQSFELWGALAAYFIEQIVGAGRPVREVVPVPVIDMPTPLLVKGFNMPPQGKMPWEATDFYSVFEQQARGAVS